MSRFREQVVVVIGAGTGLGRSLAVGFAGEGARLVVADVDPSALEITLGLARERGADALAVPTDVMREEDVDTLARRAIERYGHVDIVCSNAGVNEYTCPAWEKTAADWQWVMGVNVYGLAHAVNAFIPLMIERGKGHFVCTASNTSLHSAAGVAVYVASKKAALGFCEALQYDLWRAGAPVKVSIVCPNKIASEMPNSARNRPAALAGRMPTAEELKMKHAFLADGGHTPDEAATIVLDGIADQRFYILTNPIDARHTEQWAAGVREGRLFQTQILQLDPGKA
ncbi:MAG: SDR family NAD(P)-dependent oxidoreductase [Gammaproteobacteria bacterium]